jgi:hypothetical protein
VKAKGFDLTDAFMQKIAQDAIERVENVEKNKNYLVTLAYGMLLPDWRSFTNATNSE